MSEGKIKSRGEFKYLLKAAAIWAVSALIMLLIAGIVYSRMDLSSDSMGYVSSAMSFIAALVAAMGALKNDKEGILYKALISAGFICLILLSIGYILDSEKLSPSGILSVVSFTFSGFLLGGLILSLKTGKKGHHKLKPGRKT